MSTAARNDEIVRLRKEGVGPREIARQMGLSPNVVAGVLHRSGQTDRWSVSCRGNGLSAPELAAIRRRRARGETLLAIAEDYGVTHTAISKICRRQNCWAAA